MNSAAAKYSPEFIKSVADKFAAKIERNGGEAPCRMAGEAIAVFHSERFERVGSRAGGFQSTESIWRIKGAAQ